jgi:tetratricopeptide (TPR) repeat protein
LNIFWTKNGTAVLALCGLVAVGILANGAWGYLQAQKELEVQKAYAAATTSDQLKSFAAAHADHSLAGIAQLRLADEAYTAGKSADALAGYDKVVAILKTGPLVARAQLGRALAKVQAGKGTEAITDLRQLVSAAAQPKGARAEAAYHLTSLAAEAANAADVQKYSDQLMQLDPSGPWTQRALMLRASLPAAPAPAKADVPAGGVQITLPAK